MEHHHPLLSQAQLLYLKTLLPPRVSFQLTTPLDSKRPRVVKKLDESFTSEIRLTPSKKRHPTEKMSIEKLKKEEEACPKVDPKGMESGTKSRSRKEEVEKVLTTFLIRLKMHKSSWPFRMPVDPVTQAVPNYFEIVKEPMDLKTIDRKIKSSTYNNFS